MTTKTTKYSIIAAIAVTAVLMGASVSISEAEVTRDIAVSSGSKFDANKQVGLPYIEKSVVSNDLTMKDSNNIVMELVLRNAAEGTYLVLKPIATESGFVSDVTLTREQVFERSQLANEGRQVAGIVTDKSMLSFDTERIVLLPDVPVTFTVQIDVPKVLQAQNDRSGVNINIGFDVLENVGHEKTPMKTGSIFLEGANYEQ